MKDSRIQAETRKGREMVPVKREMRVQGGAVPRKPAGKEHVEETVRPKTIVGIG